MKVWIIPVVLLFVGGAIFLGLRRDESRSVADNQPNLGGSEKTLIEQTDKSIERTDKSIERTDKSIERTDKSIERTDKSTEQQDIPPPPESITQNEESLSIDDIEDRLHEILLRGTYTVLDNGLISFSEDAQIRLPQGPTISSGEGFMISDYELRNFGGDLLIGSGSTPHAHKGLLTLSEHTNGFTLTTFKEDIEKEIIKRSSNRVAEGI